MAHALGVAPERLLLLEGDTLGGEERTRWQTALNQRIQRRPVSQIVGERLFWGRPFRVTRDTLDPRPETEALVDAALSQPFDRVLDLGTGTGCLIVTLLAERPEAMGVAVDLSSAALAVARDNADRLGVADRAEFHQGDWFAPVTGTYDLIVSNPPYIDEAELPALAPEVRDWEPHMALSPGPDGLAAIRSIAGAVRPFMRPGCRLIVEIGWRQGAAASAIFEAAGFRARVLADLDGRDRVILAE
jgi:release factor glutamine methyltransferase